MPDKSFLSDILKRIAGAGPFLSAKGAPTSADLLNQCRVLLSERSEAAGLKTALHLLDLYKAASPEEKRAFFNGIVEEFGVNETALQEAIDAWEPGNPAIAHKLYYAAEPRSQELIRRINRVPGAAGRLVHMRAEFLKYLKENPNLVWLDKDFRHLFSAWFNRGFLEIVQIDWSTPAAILEKIIQYEAVHEITDWDDLHQRVAMPDRRLFAFFHPAMPGDPLIFVEVALTGSIPGSIAPILEKDREILDPQAATTAVFYSISNCQRGLRGISFGNFLIKQVVMELQRELPNLNTFVTLSPVPGLRKWAVKAMETEDQLLKPEDRAVLEALGEDDQPEPDFAARLAALYLTHAKTSKGTAYDSVAHFHLGNGAALHKVHSAADMSERGIANSWGVMVNYLYKEPKIEIQHQAYANDGVVTASTEVNNLATPRKRIAAIASGS